MTSKNRINKASKLIRQFSEVRKMMIEFDHEKTTILFDKEDLKELEDILEEYIALKVFDEVNCK